jgi:hypothetical protein
MFVMPMPALVINIQVDSLALLSGLPLHECVFIVDNSDFSQGKGQAALRSVALQGQRVRWTLTSIDLQAPAWLKKIEFVDSHVTGLAQPVPDGHLERIEADDSRTARAVVWEGLIPPTAMIGTAYPYQIHLSFGNDVGAPVVVRGCEIEVRGVDPYGTGGASGAAWASKAFSASGGVL